MIRFVPALSVLPCTQIFALMFTLSLLRPLDSALWHLYVVSILSRPYQCIGLPPFNFSAHSDYHAVPH